MSTLEPPTTARPPWRDVRITAPSDDLGPARLRERRLLKNTLAVLTTIYLVSIAAFVLLAYQLETGPGTVAAAGLMLLAIFALLVRALPGHPHARFGAANIITGIRAAMVSFFGAAMLFGNPAGPTELYTLFVLVAVALGLDGIDGYAARRTGLQSALGTRFDMEVDALLILLLSLAAVLLEKAGLWVLAIGLMRYVFVVAQIPLPFLRHPLPPSFRRKLICVIQVGALCVLVLPVVTPPVSTAIAATALLLIAYSFGADVIHLARERQRAGWPRRRLTVTARKRSPWGATPSNETRP